MPSVIIRWIFARKASGFTLWEALAALALVGAIVAFGISPLLFNTSDAKQRTMALESAKMISEAYRLWQADHVDQDGMCKADLLPYLNTIGSFQTLGEWTNTAGNPDLAVQFQNGGFLTIGFGQLGSSGYAYIARNCFNTAVTNSALLFNFYSKIAPILSNQQTTVTFLLYPDGSIRTWETMLPNTNLYLSNTNTIFGPINPLIGPDPSWFHW